MSEQRNISYAELVALQNLFYEQVERDGIIFPNEEIEQECLFDFQQQYIDGDDEPQINVNF